MIVYHHRLRIRYAETDKMGFAYYGNYFTYLEVARVELIRNLGISYKTMEDNGVILPVVSSNIKYLKPIYYDENITIETKILEMPTRKITFHYKILNEQEECCTRAEVTLFFVDQKTNRPIHPPDYIHQAFASHFSD